MSVQLFGIAGRCFCPLLLHDFTLSAVCQHSEQTAVINSFKEMHSANQMTRGQTNRRTDGRTCITKVIARFFGTFHSKVKKSDKMKLK
jgi:hypothetical protein